MKILVVGGGSGGHISPVVAVIEEIWKIKPRARVEFWTDKKFFVNVSKLCVNLGPGVRVKKIVAGKLRRYTNFGLIDYLQHFDVVLKNIFDGLKVLVGFCQSLSGLRKFRPDVIFLKGGYVCLPVGLAARVMKIPYMIHDSDTVPGLTNRLLSKRAVKIATGMPLENYKYPLEKAEWTGIPVAENFTPVTMKRQRELKKSLGFDTGEALVVVTGGSQGAANINRAMREILPKMLKFASVILVAGRERYPEMLDLKEYEVWEEGKLKTNFRMLEFSAEMQDLFGAADVVVSRAGASTITELASMGKAVVMVPNHKLPGRHQVKNAELFAKEKAALVIEDAKIVKDPELLLAAVRKLVKDDDLRKTTAKNLKNFARDDAAGRLAEMILGVSKDAVKKK